MGWLLDMAYGAAYAGYRLLPGQKQRQGWRERFGHLEPLPAPAGRRLLVHAVSVGEVNAAAALLREMESRQSFSEIVVSVTTDTGMAQARKLFEPRHRVVRYPLDFSRSVERFLDAVRPNVVALVELEVWPHFTASCARRGVPVCVVNGRLSERSFSRYRCVRGVIAPMFRRLSAVAAQTQEYAERFVSLGVPPEAVRVTDSVKWDIDASTPAGVDQLAREMGIDRGRPVIVAGSTGPGEEKLLIETCPPGAQLVLAPRKPERFEEVARLGSGIVRRSGAGPTLPRGAAHARLFLLDTMGELLKAYALADVAVVGRSFLGLHGSNPLEAVALDKPVVIGPFHSDFQEIVDSLRRAGGIVVTDQPGAAVAELLADATRRESMIAAGRETLNRKRGAAKRQCEVVESMLKAPGV